MHDTQGNPYSPPAAALEVSPSAGQSQAAGRGARLTAAIIDGILFMVLLIPIQLMTGYIERMQALQASVTEQLLMLLVGPLIILVLNGFLLSVCGQTIGKRLLSVQIVDNDAGSIPSLKHSFVYRMLWALPFAAFFVLIPGEFDNMLLFFIFLVDVLLIFRADRRCLHDLIAGTRVVKVCGGSGR